MEREGFSFDTVISTKYLANYWNTQLSGIPLIDIAVKSSYDSKVQVLEIKKHIGVQFTKDHLVVMKP